MRKGVAEISRKDVIWNYIATFFKIGSGLILLPFILKMMPTETVGIWTIFTTITTLIALLDFGFNPSFTRNVTYVFSGVKELKKKGIAELNENNDIDYGLLKGTISAMRWFYSRMAFIVLFLLLIVGNIYMFFLLQSYTGDKIDLCIAWVILIILNAYDIYTLYYDSLLQGKGLIKISKQINVVGQSLYLIMAIILIALGQGLIAIVSAQALSIIVRRFLSYRVFFTNEIKSTLKSIKNQNQKEIISAIYPNALKIGLTSIGSFLVNKSAIFMGSIFLTLSEVAMYGITIQVVGILSSLAGVYYNSYIPKITQLRTTNSMQQLKTIFFRGSVIQLFIFILGGLAFVLFGNYALDIIDSQTKFLGTGMLVAILIISFLERNHSLAAGFLLAKNEVPFFAASLWSGVATVLLLWILLDVVHWGVWGLILAQGMVQLVYQNWKWPLVFFKEIR
jgi:O-antigen/teichoic acid export membrane protein